MGTANHIVLRDPQLKANPYPLFARLRREAPVCLARGVTRSFWLVTRYDDVIFVLKDSRFAANRKNAPTPPRRGIEKLIFHIYGPLLTNMLGSDEPDHGRLRALVHQAFTMRRVENLRERIEELTNEYLDRVERRRQWDLVADYALPLPVTIIAEMLGVPERERPQFRKWSDALVVSFGRSLQRMLGNTPGMMAFLRYIRSQVRLRRRRPQDDLIGALVMAEEHGVMGCLTSANRDESQFDRPDELDVGREPNRHLAFGQGTHHCLGVFLARLETQVAFTTLLRRCPDLRMAAPRESLRWRPSFLLRGLESLPVSATPFSPHLRREAVTSPFQSGRAGGPAES